MWVFARLWFFAGLGYVPTVARHADLLVGSNSNLREHNTKEPPSPWTCTNMRIDVLVVLEGPSDRATAPTFRDIAETVQDGLHGLGHLSSIVYCANIAFDGCVAEGGKVIVLAAHNLASFSTMEGESVVLKWKLLPPDAVLYNFEQVPRGLPPEWSLPSGVHPGGLGPHTGSSLVSSQTLLIYASFTVWDYSEENVQRLREVGIHADLVPLGFSAKLASRNDSFRHSQREDHDEIDEDIDVLFIGMETPTRRATISRLREAGISVVHPNSDGIHPYGAEFDAMSARSKIVLSLNAFSDAVDECSCRGSSSSSSSSRSGRSSTINGVNDGSGAPCNTGREWKMPRLARLLANGRFVVSEMSGTAQERDKLSGGLVFADLGELAETCRYYLQRPHLRAAIASRGRQLFERQVETDILSKPVGVMLGEREKNGGTKSDSLKLDRPHSDRKSCGSSASS